MEASSAAAAAAAAAAVVVAAEPGVCSIMAAARGACPH